MDREKVMKGFVCHVLSKPENCCDCPYRKGWKTCDGKELFDDIYAFLKEHDGLKRYDDGSTEP